MIIKHLHKQSQESKQTFNELVDRVVTIVEQHYEQSLSNDKIKPFVAISHVFDSLIDHRERKTKKPIWDKLVKYISDHESRIRVETQYIDGEETSVWRWVLPKNMISSPLNTDRSPEIVPTINPSPRYNQSITSNKINNSNEIKSSSNSQTSWQSEAFAKQNQTMLSPTPCLKIRNMFDQEE
jgi:hypothetical protein